MSRVPIGQFSRLYIYFFLCQSNLCVKWQNTNQVTGSGGRLGHFVLSGEGILKQKASAGPSSPWCRRRFWCANSAAVRWRIRSVSTPDVSFCVTAAAETTQIYRTTDEPNMSSCCCFMLSFLWGSKEPSVRVRKRSCSGIKPTWFCVQNDAADSHTHTRGWKSTRSLQQLRFTVTHETETQSWTAVTGFTLHPQVITRWCERDVTRLVHNLWHVRLYRWFSWTGLKRPDHQNIHRSAVYL